MTTTERTRERCPDCACLMPFPEEWETVEEGGLPDLCWGDPFVCSRRAAFRVVRYREALEHIAQSVGARANGKDARAMAQFARNVLQEDVEDANALPGEQP